MARLTECEITLTLEDTTAKPDASITTSNNFSFANITLLEKDDINILDYGTLELNQFILDGTQQPLPNNLYDGGFALLGTDISSVELERDSITLDVIFVEKHDSMGITFNFSNDYPSTIRLTWYYNTTILDAITFTPDSLSYFCENKVEGFNKVIAVISGSHVPYRHLRLDSITFGANLTFNSTSLKKAILTEEVDPVCDRLTINDIDFTALDESKGFNVLNPNGKYSLLRRGQKVIVREKYNDSKIEMGTFYLDNYSSNKETLITFNAIDGIGILGTTKFYNGRIYNQVKAGIILDEIFESAGWEKYQIDTDVYNTLLSGYLPICTHREAIRQVAFALRAIVDCSRSDKIKIYRQESVADLKIKYDRKFQGGDVGVLNYVSAIDVTMHEYNLGTELKQLFSGTLSVGTNRITFNNPSSINTITGGMLGENSVNYAYVTVSTETEVTIMGYEYMDNKSTITIENKNKKLGASENVKTVDNITLISKYNINLVANHLINYYMLDRQANQRFILESEHAGRWVSLKSQQGRFVTGSIEKMKIDLTGGFLADATITGYNSLEKDPFFTGIEVYTGEEVGVI